MRQQLIAFLRGIRTFLQDKFDDPDSKWPYIIVAAICTIAVIIGTIFFVELTHRTMGDLMADYDTKIFNELWSYRTPPLTKYFVAVTEIGDVMGYVVVFILCIILFAIVMKSWKTIGQLTLVLVLALSSNVLLKQIINRARPVTEHLVTVKTLSYPSGHAMLSMAFYGLLIYLVIHFKMNKLLKVVTVFLLAFLIFSIGVSRIYLGVHYPSDVLGGYVAGFIWVVFCVLIFNLIKIFRRDPSTSL